MDLVVTWITIGFSHGSMRYRNLPLVPRPLACYQMIESVGEVADRVGDYKKWGLEPYIV